MSLISFVFSFIIVMNLSIILGFRIHKRIVERTNQEIRSKLNSLTVDLNRILNSLREPVLEEDSVSEMKGIFKSISDEKYCDSKSEIIAYEVNSLSIVISGFLENLLEKNK